MWSNAFVLHTIDRRRRAKGRKKRQEQEQTKKKNKGKDGTTKAKMEKGGRTVPLSLRRPWLETIYKTHRQHKGKKKKRDAQSFETTVEKTKKERRRGVKKEGRKVGEPPILTILLFSLSWSALVFLCSLCNFLCTGKQKASLSFPDGRVLTTYCIMVGMFLLRRIIGSLHLLSLWVPFDPFLQSFLSTQCLAFLSFSPSKYKEKRVKGRQIVRML